MMPFQKNFKDVFYKLVKEPTLGNFREFVKHNTGEHNAIDFKASWLKADKLAKEILAIANSGGGILVFGIQENDDGSFSCTGLTQLEDKADIGKKLGKYISTDLKYEVYDLSYSDSEYKELEGKQFQLLVIDDIPACVPFIASKSGTDIKEGTIYTRRGTSCEEVNETEIRQIIQRRLSHEFPNGGHPLSLSDHLDQLQALYAHIPKNVSIPGFPSPDMPLDSVINGFWRSLIASNPNPLYPQETYDAFVASMIEAKKGKIRRVLDLQ